MNITGLFIYRPVMTTLVMLGILIFGVMGYRALPVSDLPTVDFPTIVVTANLPGASPETMASSVATPLEKQFSAIAGLDSMNSAKYPGKDPRYAAVQFEPEHRRRRSRRPVHDRPSLERPPNEYAHPTILSQGQPRRHFHSPTLLELANPASFRR